MPCWHHEGWRYVKCSWVNTLIAEAKQLLCLWLVQSGHKVDPKAHALLHELEVEVEFWQQLLAIYDKQVLKVNICLLGFWLEITEKHVIPLYVATVNVYKNFIMMMNVAVKNLHPCIPIFMVHEVVRIPVVIKLRVCGYNAGSSIAIPIFTVLSYCVIYMYMYILYTCSCMCNFHGNFAIPPWFLMLSVKCTLSFLSS